MHLAPSSLLSKLGESLVPLFSSDYVNNVIQKHCCKFILCDMTGESAI